MRRANDCSASNKRMWVESSEQLVDVLLNMLPYFILYLVNKKE